MRISEMTTQQGMKCIAMIAKPVSNLVKDKEFMTTFAGLRKVKEESATIGEMVGAVIEKVVPLIVEKHEADFYQLAAGLCSTSVEKVKEMNFLKLIAELRDSIDDELINFFTSSKAQK